MPDRRDLPVIVLAGFLGITIYHTALNFGERTVTSGAAALLISVEPDLHRDAVEPLPRRAGHAVGMDRHRHLVRGRRAHRVRRGRRRDV